MLAPQLGGGVGGGLEYNILWQYLVTTVHILSCCSYFNFAETEKVDYKNKELLIVYRVQTHILSATDQ